MLGQNGTYGRVLRGVCVIFCFAFSFLVFALILFHSELQSKGIFFTLYFFLRPGQARLALEGLRVYRAAALFVNNGGGQTIGA